MPEALNDVRVSSYLTEGDDVTVKVHMDHLISWNLTDTNPGGVLAAGFIHLMMSSQAPDAFFIFALDVVRSFVLFVGYDDVGV